MHQVQTARSIAARRRRFVLLLLVALAIVTFLDRISIAVAGPRIQDELGIPPDRWGWVLGAFVLAYGLFEVPTGAMGDRLGQRKVLTRIVLWWSGFTCLTGLCTGYYSLLATRFLFGAGEAGAYPNMSGVLARWFPPGERARTQGFIWAASRFGGALSPLLVVPLQARVGWRVAFVILGLVGVAWAICWRVWYRDNPADLGVLPPPDESGPSASAVQAASSARGGHSVPWKLLLRRPQLWLIFVMYFFYAWGSWFYFAWFPVYLVKGAGFTEAEMGVFSALPFLLGTAGNLAGGYLGDWAARRFGLTAGRRLMGAGSLALSATLLAVLAVTHDKTAVVVIASLGFGIADLMLPTAWAVCLDIGRAHAGVVTGTMNTAGQLGGFVCTVLFGYIVKATGSYSAPLWTVAAMVMIAAILFTRIDPSRPLIPSEQH